MKKRFQMVWENIKKYEYDGVFQSKFDADGDRWTLFIEKNNYEYPINSPINPLLEAQTIVEKNNQYLLDKEKIILLGIGLGYVLDEILDKYDDKKILIVEKNSEILYRFLSRIDLRDRKYDKIEQILLDNDIGETLLNEYVNKNINRRIGVLSLPAYENIFGNEYHKSFKRIRDYLKMYKMGLGTNMAFQKRWIINSIINIKRNLETKSMYGMPEENIQGKNVIIVAAGPSLNFEIENLKKIRETNSALIFAVGSAINTLVENEIYPHAALTYDPQGSNAMVYKKLVDNNIDKVPLIYGSSVGFETIKNYPGELVHMITSQDTVSSYFLRRENKLDIVYDAPSIAVVTLQLLMRFKPSRIIFVGQNLGYFNNRHYAEGIDYGHTMGEDKENGLKEEFIKNAVKDVDVDGNELLTTNAFISFRKNIEGFIERSRNIDFVNTTVGGMKISGAPFMKMSEVMDKYMVEGEVKDYIFDYEIEEYNKALIKMHRIEFNNSFLEYNKHIDSILEIFRSMDKNRKKDNIENLLKKFDKHFKAIGDNGFYNIILRPMNRVSHEMLLKKVNDIKFEKNISRKVDLVITNFGKFISSLEDDVDSFIEVIRMMDDELEKFISE
ncbi:MAG: DUF115 domain-containing protein [Firmicutes bacterium]|nr:DUF115 domain-containing protein [Bacillota bacterium]